MTMQIAAWMTPRSSATTTMANVTQRLAPTGTAYANQGKPLEGLMASRHDAVCVVRRWAGVSLAHVEQGITKKDSHHCRYHQYILAVLPVC
jgi:hypothetical protein